MGPKKTANFGKFSSEITQRNNAQLCNIFSGFLDFFLFSWVRDVSSIILFQFGGVTTFESQSFDSYNNWTPAAIGRKKLEREKKTRTSKNLQKKTMKIAYLIAH